MLLNSLIFLFFFNFVKPETPNTFGGLVESVSRRVRAVLADLHDSSQVLLMLWLVLVYL